MLSGYNHYIEKKQTNFLIVYLHNASPMLFSCCISMFIVLMLSLITISIPTLLFAPSSLKTVPCYWIIPSSFSICVSTLHIDVGFVSSTVFVSESTFDLINALTKYW